MSATHQAWTDDPRHYLRRVSPFEFEVTAPPITGVFTFPPSRLMSNENDREAIVTTPVPPPSEPVTNTENDRPEPKLALNPPSNEWDTAFLKDQDSVFAEAVRLVAKAGRRMDEERKGREAESQKRADFETESLALQRSILVCTERAEKSQQANFELVFDEIGKLKKSDEHHDQRLAEGDAEFERLQQAIADVKVEVLAALPDVLTKLMVPYIDRIEALERELRAYVTARQAAPPAGT